MVENELVLTQIIPDTDSRVGLISLNRPKVLNALSPDMLSAICEGMEYLEKTNQVRVIVITGNPRTFAAGADIKAMAKAFPTDIVEANTIQYWKRIWKTPVPLIAAVSGYAYGGGCELAMSCDIIVASETAKFAQPEIKLGIIPGAGGTQRLVKAIGPYRAMEMVLTGEPISAKEAKNFGLVNRIVPVERYLDEALDIARTIAGRPPIAIQKARECLLHGLMHTMAEGMELERKNFILLFDTNDQKEGMTAFLEKRTPIFTGK